MIDKISKAEFTEALPIALRKRNRLIERYGDNAGKRYSNEYLFSLIREAVYFNRLENQITKGELF